jgi:hypothetical protein
LKIIESKTCPKTICPNRSFIKSMPVAGALGLNAAVDGVALVAARAEADGVVVGRLAEGVLTAVGGLAGVATAAGDAGFAGDAVLGSML